MIFILLYMLLYVRRITKWAMCDSSQTSSQSINFIKRIHDHNKHKQNVFSSNLTWKLLFSFSLCWRRWRQLLILASVSHYYVFKVPSPENNRRYVQRSMKYDYDESHWPMLLWTWSKKADFYLKGIPVSCLIAKEFTGDVTCSVVNRYWLILVARCSCICKSPFLS